MQLRLDIFELVGEIMVEQELDVREKLGTLKFETDSEENAHITIVQDICQQCPHHLCIAGCPAECFRFVEKKMVFRYEDCVECGTCYLMCDQGSVTWSLPKGGFGVKYELG
ncbi:MAG: ferredoxin family protein [Candidatus Hodarchaeales archaeon]|jgi:ferredoxin like protein